MSKLHARQTVKGSIWIILLWQLFNASNSWKLEPIEFAKNFTHSRESDGLLSKKIAYDMRVTTDNKVTFVSMECERLVNATTCNVTKETYDFDKPSDALQKKSCSFQLEGEKSTPLSIEKVYGLSGNNVVYDLTYANFNEATFLRLLFTGIVDSLRIIQIMNLDNCEARNVDVKVETTYDPQVNILPRHRDNERFDVFYTNSVECDNNTRARNTFDVSGNVVEGPVCVFDQSRYESVESKAVEYEIFSNDRYFMLDKNATVCRGYLADYNGSEVKEIFKSDCNLGGLSPDLRVSTTHGHITYCHLQDYETTINCSTIDVSSDKTTNVSLTFPNRVLKLNIFNLDNGSILALTARVDKYESEDTDKGEGENIRETRDLELLEVNNENVEAIYELRRFDNNGTQTGEVMKIENWSCQDPINKGAEAFEEIISDRVCLKFMCKAESDRREEDYRVDFKFHMRCLTI